MGVVNCLCVEAEVVLHCMVTVDSSHWMLHDESEMFGSFSCEYWSNIRDSRGQ